MAQIVYVYYNLPNNLLRSAFFVKKQDNEYKFSLLVNVRMYKKKYHTRAEWC